MLNSLESQFNDVTQSLDFEQIEQELEELKYELETPYIDKRAINNENILEELQACFNEVSEKEKTLKQLIQVFEFVIEKNNDVTESYKEIYHTLRASEEDNIFKDSLIKGYKEKILKLEEAVDKMEQQNVDLQHDALKLQRQLKTKDIENMPQNHLQAFEARVKRQSLIDTSGTISGLQEALKSSRSDQEEMESTIDDKNNIIDNLKRENTQLLNNYNEQTRKFKSLEDDLSKMNEMKQQLENEFNLAVHDHEAHIENLIKQRDTCKSEYAILQKTYKELEVKLGKVCNKVDTKPSSGRVETEASNNEDDPAKKYEVVSEEADDNQSINSDLFRGDQYELVAERRDTYEKIGDLMNRSSYYGEIEFLDDPRSRGPSFEKKPDDLVRFIDQSTQTSNHPDIPVLNLNKVEESKFLPSINEEDEEDRSMSFASRRSMSSNINLNASIRKDALEEYFKMSVLAQKMSHKDLDSVCHLKSSQLYYKVRTKNIPFYRWYSWIEQELTQQYLHALYNRQSSNNTLRRNSSNHLQRNSLGKKSYKSIKNMYGDDHIFERSQNNKYRRLSNANNATTNRS